MSTKRQSVARWFGTCALIILILGEFAFIAEATTGWVSKTYSTALRSQFMPVTVGYDGEAGDAVPVSASAPLPVTGTVTTGDTNLGAKADSSATTDTGSFSLISLTKRLATHLTRLWQGPTASCAHLRGSGATSVPANSSGTSVDAGATGTGYWSSASNLGRTFAIELSLDTGSTILMPQQSFTWSVPAAATPDNATFKNNCVICSVSAATYVAVTTCDDD